MNRDDEGQAAVELALVTPLVFVVLLIVVQVGVVARNQVLVVHAAREAARAAAVDGDPHAPRRAAVRGSGLKADRLRVETSYKEGYGGLVSVRVRYLDPTEIPVVGSLLPSIPLSASAAMRSERSRFVQESAQAAKKLQESRHEKANQSSGG